MDPSISVEKQKKALQLKYLLALSGKGSDQQTLDIMNSLYPFTDYPLCKLPPIEFCQYEIDEIITPDLKRNLMTYFYVIVLGKCCIKKDIYGYEQQKFIDINIKQRLMFNFDQGEIELKAIKPTKLLKIHNIWLKMAKDRVKDKNRKYIQQKLIKIPFFSSLTFNQFNKICDVAVVDAIGPNETLLSQGITPYRLYVITEGELMIFKKIDFAKEETVWRQINDELQKRNEFCQQLYEYLVREPTMKNQIFNINFQVKLLGQGSLICGTQTLTESPLNFSIISTLKTKTISIKYPDLYVLNPSRLIDIRSWPLIQIDKKKLRKQYYYQIQWQRYKDYLKKEKQIQRLQAQKFEDYLRKDVNLNEKKYPYFPEKIGDGYIIDSPAGKMYRVKQITYKKS